MEYNKRLERVQIGRSKEVPKDSKIWYLWIKEDGSWDADSSIPEEEKLKAKSIFAVWNGQWRTNLFLMDKEDI